MHTLYDTNGIIDNGPLYIQWYPIGYIGYTVVYYKCSTMTKRNNNVANVNCKD